MSSGPCKSCGTCCQTPERCAHCGMCKNCGKAIAPFSIAAPVTVPFVPPFVPYPPPFVPDPYPFPYPQPTIIPWPPPMLPDIIYRAQPSSGEYTMEMDGPMMDTSHMTWGERPGAWQ